MVLHKVQMSLMNQIREAYAILMRKKMESVPDEKILDTPLKSDIHEIMYTWISQIFKLQGRYLSKKTRFK